MKAERDLQKQKKELVDLKAVNNNQVRQDVRKSKQERERLDKP